MTIDVWMQHPTQRWLDSDWTASVARWLGADWSTDALDADATIAAMDAGDVGHGLLSAWYGPQGPLISNADVADLIARYPGRFSGLAGVDLERPMDAVREVRRRVDELGFVGVRIIPWLWEAPPTDRRYYPLYAACVDSSVPCCTQVGHTGPLRPSETGRPIPYIDQVALDFPELVLVCGHIGYPWTEEMIAVCRKHPNVYIDTSAYTARRYPAELVAFMRSRSGRSRVLFGTNFPMIKPVDAKSGLDSLGLDDEAQELFLSGNARRVFGLEP